MSRLVGLLKSEFESYFSHILHWVSLGTVYDILFFLFFKTEIMISTSKGCCGHQIKFTQYILSTHVPTIMLGSGIETELAGQCVCTVLSTKFGIQKASAGNVCYHQHNHHHYVCVMLHKHGIIQLHFKPSSLSQNKEIILPSKEV